jgi:hypothetical protein
MKRGGPQTKSNNVGKGTLPLPEIIPRFTDRPAYNLIAILVDTWPDTLHQALLSSFVFGRSHVQVLARRTATLDKVSVFLQSLQLYGRTETGIRSRPTNFELVIYLSSYQIRLHRMAHSDWHISERTIILRGARDSEVGIATRYWLDGPGIESRWGRDFPHLSRPALGPSQLSI